MKIGQDIGSQMQLDSSKFSPKYCLKQLFYEDNFPPTATAILKVTGILFEHLRLYSCNYTNYNCYHFWMVDHVINALSGVHTAQGRRGHNQTDGGGIFSVEHFCRVRYGKTARKR